MGKPGSIKVEFAGNKDLCFSLQSTERRAVDDSIPIPLKRRSEQFRRSRLVGSQVRIVVERINGAHKMIGAKSRPAATEAN